jgi:hypothetical protein
MARAGPRTTNIVADPVNMTIKLAANNNGLR